MRFFFCVAFAFLTLCAAFRPRDLRSTGGAGAAAADCAGGDATACGLLLNLCLFRHYDAAALPCRLHAELLAEGTAGVFPLYYNDSGVLHDYVSAVHQGKRKQLPLFYVDVYDWRGHKKGTKLLSAVLNHCNMEESNLEALLRLGSNGMVSCSRAWSLTEPPNETDVYEIFLADSINASIRIPIPVMINYFNYDIEVQELTDILSGKTTFYSRFFVDDAMGGLGLTASYATTLRRSAIFMINHGDAGLLPLVVLQYASMQINASGEDVLDASQGGTTMRDASDNNAVNHFLMISLIIICLICFFSSWIRACGYMRRRQNMMVDFGAVVRFLVYFCNHVGNLCAIMVALVSWFILALFRLQEESVGFVVNDRYIYLDAMLYIATVTKGIFVVFKILEQCNAEYFVIDWERSKGQLLRENRILPVSMWRSTFVANELNELQMLRRWRPLLSMVIVLFFLNGLGFLSYAESLLVDNGAKNNAVAHSVTTLRIAVSTFLWFAVCSVLDLVGYQFLYKFVSVHPLRAFIDLCSVSNISILILPETQWGHYLHGESIHAHSDVSMEEFQQNLHLESQGNLPVRGLGGQSVCQTFEVFLSIYVRQYLYMCYAGIEAEHQKSHGKKPKPVQPGRRWHFLESVLGFSRKSREYSAETLAIKKCINSALRQSVQSGEGNILMKSTMHRFFDLTPNILYMNGPQSGDKGGKTLFFVDEVIAYGNSFLFGIDIDIFVFYTMLYTAVDASLHNTYVALALTYLVEILLYWYRRNEGLANISLKTLIDDRFFL